MKINYASGNFNSCCSQLTKKINLEQELSGNLKPNSTKKLNFEKWAFNGKQPCSMNNPEEDKFMFFLVILRVCLASSYEGEENRKWETNRPEKV